LLLFEKSNQKLFTLAVGATKNKKNCFFCFWWTTLWAQ